MFSSPHRIMRFNPAVENFASKIKRATVRCMLPVVVQHPLAQCHLAAIRAAATPPHQFRRHLNLLARMLFLEATCELPVQEIAVRLTLAYFQLKVATLLRLLLQQDQQSRD